MTMDGSVFVTVFWLLMLAMSSTCGQMIKDCRGENLGTPDQVTCPAEPFRIACASHEVVTATVCFGFDETVSAKEGNCNYSSGACLDEYSASADDEFEIELDQCLWTTHECNITVDDGTFKCNPFDSGLCINFSQRYHYITAFNVECIDGDTVFDICNVTEHTSTLSTIGYIHSPGYPARVYGTRNCSHAFGTDERKSFEFLIQRVHLDATKGDHVTISALLADGTRGEGRTWNGNVEDTHENFTLGAAHGFLVEYQQHTGSLDGFFFSFEVSEARTVEPTTSPSPPTCAEPQHCGSSHITYNGLGLVVLVAWCISLLD